MEAASTDREAEHLHESLWRLTGLLAVDSDLLDKLADGRLEIISCLLDARRNLCAVCLDRLEDQLPIAVDWPSLGLPTGSSETAWRIYRDRLEDAVAEVMRGGHCAD